MPTVVAYWASMTYGSRRLKINCLLCTISKPRRSQKSRGAGDTPGGSPWGDLWGIQGALCGDPLGESPEGSQGVTVVTFSFVFYCVLFGVLGKRTLCSVMVRDSVNSYPYIALVPKLPLNLCVD